MKFLVAFCALFAVASASGLYYSPGQLLVRTAIQPAIEQYHAQDEFGQYSYGYSEPLSSKQEVKTLDGVTRGSYSYQDAEGKVQTVDYVADDGGFRVAATNLPKPVEIPEIIPAKSPLPVVETPEVATARIAHLAAFEEAKARAASASAPSQISDRIDPYDLPRPVEDTPEVALAKAEHFRAVENVKLRNAVIKETNELSEKGTPIVTAAGQIITSAGAPVRYISGSPLPLQVAVPYRAAILPSGFAYSYGLNGGILPGSRFLSSHYIQQ